VHEFVAEINHLLEEFSPALLGCTHELPGDLAFDHPCTLHRVVVPVRFHAHHVNDSLERLLPADRQLYHHRPQGKPVLHHRQRIVEIGAHAVHFIYKSNPRTVIFVGLPPHGLRLRLYAGHRIEYHYASIEHPKAPLDFGSEIHMTRGIYNVDLMILPVAGGGSSGNSNTALFFLGHPIHYRSPIIHIPQLVGYAGVIQDPLSKRCFTCIDMRDNADIPYSL
jgi:hypothetical protein